MKKHLMVALVFFGGLASTASANHLVLTNLALVNVSGGSADVQFDVSWENSWHASWNDNGDTVTVTNWDAVWIFAKYRFSGGVWKHLLLSDTGHAVCGGLILSPATNNDLRLGAMIYRTAEGSGEVSCEGVRLHWDYAASGVVSTTDLDIAVFGIEMVYIPEGPFYLGSGGAENYAFHRYPDTLEPYLVSNAAPITCGAVTGQLYSTSHDLNSSGDIPTGYSAFYLMKYEISQQQYADYLNLLDPMNATNRYDPANYGYLGYSIRVSNGVYTADAPDRACNMFSYDDFTRYLDWCGLRPMGELEFEKACRGPRYPYPNEYVWGTTTVYPGQTGVVGVAGSGTETALPTNANVVIQNLSTNPSRCGIFATASQSREAAGAGYYGNMDLGGNILEFCLALRWWARGFADVYGDGNEYTAPPGEWMGGANEGVGWRGGGWRDAIQYVRISERSIANWGLSRSTRQSDYGGRGVRRVP